MLNSGNCKHFEDSEYVFHNKARINNGRINKVILNFFLKELIIKNLLLRKNLFLKRNDPGERRPSKGWSL